MTIKDVYAWDKMTIPAENFERVCKNFSTIYKSYKRIKNNEDYKNNSSYNSTLEKMMSKLRGIYDTCFWMKLDNILLNWCFEEDFLDEELCDVVGLNFHATTDIYIDVFGTRQLSAFPRKKLSKHDDKGE